MYVPPRRRSRAECQREHITGYSARNTCVTSRLTCRYLDIALNTLWVALTGSNDAGELYVPEAQITFPCKALQATFADTIVRGSGLPYPACMPAPVFGFVDGVCARIQKPSHIINDRLHYSGLKHCHCVNNMLVFGPDGECAMCIRLRSAACIVAASYPISAIVVLCFI